MGGKKGGESGIAGVRQSGSLKGEEKKNEFSAPLIQKR